MRRRDFLSTFAFGAILTPHAASAQQKAMPVVGVLSGGFPGSTAISPLSVAAFRQGLSDAGYIEEQNVAIEYRWAGNRYDRMRALAADLVGLKVDVIACLGNAVTLAAKSTTSTIPTVFAIGTDPVELGLVASLARPGGNLTPPGQPSPSRPSPPSPAFLACRWNISGAPAPGLRNPVGAMIGTDFGL